MGKIERLGGGGSLKTSAVPINAHCAGSRWEPADETELAKLVAVVAMGQASYAAHIVIELEPAAPAFTDVDLCKEAKIRLTVQDKKATPRKGYPRWQRDGFIFEAISWIAARQAHGANALLKDPHIAATTQGLDGLMIELKADKSAIARVTIFEDKCTDDPRSTFTGKVMPALMKRHKNERNAELVATAATLLQIGGVDMANAAKVAAGVLDTKLRCYRAAFAVDDSHDSEKARQDLFDGFEVLSGIGQDQRIGATFVVDQKVRDWFDDLASQAHDYLDELEKVLPHV